MNIDRIFAYSRGSSRGSLRAAILLLSGLALTGCGSGLAPNKVQAPAATGAARVRGVLHGGQQPVSGVTVQLYEVTNNGYFAAARPMLTTAATTDGNGNFNLPSGYTCTAGNQVYLAGTGGNPGLAANTNNTALALMAAIGPCTYLLQNRSTMYINVNELTTVAAAWSLSRFMASPSQAGTSSGNLVGLANAFASVNNVVSFASGAMPGPTLPAGASLPVAELNSLADVLATCVNSDGNTSSGSPCGNLFAAATPPGGAAPADTITAALNIARNPTNNVAAIFSLIAGAAPFQPTLQAAPNNWMVGVHYVGGGLAQPAALAVDAGGNLWTASPANNSVNRFSPTGAPLSPASGYTDASLSSPAAIAIDSSGNAWVANSGGASATAFTPAGTVAATITSGLSHPNSLAFDGSGNLWITNSGNSSLVEFSPSSTFLQQVPLNSIPQAIAINPN